MKILYDKYIAELKQRISQEKDNVSYGGVENQREYGLACGKIRGLEESLEVFEEQWKYYKEKDED